MLLAFSFFIVNINKSVLIYLILIHDNSIQITKKRIIDRSNYNIIINSFGKKRIISSLLLVTINSRKV